MTENTIKLEFKKSIVALAGNDEGEKLYRSQIASKFNIDNLTIIEFPKEIKMVSISYTKGLFKNIVSKFKSNREFEDHVIIKASSQWLESKIKNDIFRW